MDYAGRPVVPLDETAVRAIARTIRRAATSRSRSPSCSPIRTARMSGCARGHSRGGDARASYVSLSTDVAPVHRASTSAVPPPFSTPMSAPSSRATSTSLERTLADAGLREAPDRPGERRPDHAGADDPDLHGRVRPGGRRRRRRAPRAPNSARPDVIATDVGGTTFKVAIIEGGRWAYAGETVLNQYQLRLPMVDVASIGAGGGSIAWVDGGRLRIGPQSASADPGPACYGLGGEEPTVTDADSCSATSRPTGSLAVAWRLHPDLAVAAIATRIAASALRRRCDRSRGGHPPRRRRSDGGSHPQDHARARLRSRAASP